MTSWRPVASRTTAATSPAVAVEVLGGENDPRRDDDDRDDGKNRGGHGHGHFDGPAWGAFIPPTKPAAMKDASGRATTIAKREGRGKSPGGAGGLRSVELFEHGERVVFTTGLETEEAPGLGHMIGQRGDDTHLTAAGARQGESTGVQVEPTRLGQAGEERVQPAVFAVAENRAGDGSHMDAELVRAPGKRHERDPRGPATGPASATA